MIVRRASLSQALEELESGTLKGVSTLIVSRRWWERLSLKERKTFRTRAGKADVELRADSAMKAHFVEARGGESGPALSTERSVGASVPKRAKRAPAVEPPADLARNVDLRNALTGVLEAWVDQCRRVPWHVEPDRFGVDALNEVVGSLLDVAMAPTGDYGGHERLIRAAIAHGSQRRTQETGDHAVLREYHALRHALWRFMEQSGVPAVQALPAILRVDVAISVSTTAALRGYHRTEAEPASAWEPNLLRHIQDASARLALGLDAGTTTGSKPAAKRAPR